MPVGNKSTSLSNLINQPYYAGGLANEIAKAKAYSELNKVKDVNYDKINKQYPYDTSFQEPSYNPTAGRVEMISEETRKKQIETFKKSMEANPSETQQWAIQNGFKNANDALKSIQKNDFIPNLMEHEYGHAYSRGAGIDSGYANKESDIASYMANPSELTNGLGKIQRETFRITGRRFEAPEELKAFIQSTPFEKATEGYSDEAKRTWRFLYENKEGQTDKKNKLMPVIDWASQVAPAFVESSKQFDTGMPA